jgi:hypothetical protein
MRRRHPAPRPGRRSAVERVTEEGARDTMKSVKWTRLQSRRGLIGLTLTLGLALLSTALLLSGCSEDNITGVTASGPQPTSDFTVDSSAVVPLADPDQLGGGVETGGLRGRASVSIAFWTKSKEFDANAGGTMNLSRTMALDIGANALPSDVEIDAAIWVKTVDREVDWILYDFGPGMTFLKLITLRINKALIEATADADGNFNLWYLNERTFKWELADIGKVNGADVEFKIYHFSKYAVGD